MAKYTGSNAKPKLQLTGTDGITYTYSLYKDYSTFPLTSGDGTYQVGVYENVSDDRYTTLLSETFSVTLTDPLKPYLYPNQYVNFTADSLPVAKAEELADGASSDLDIISSVYNYIITHFTYDYSKASSVTSGYLPDIDEVFTSEKGICFDYAAVMTFLMIAVILVLIAKVVPVFSKVYAELGSELTGTARTLLHISTILNHYMLGFIIAFLVLLIICMILYHTDLGRVLFLGQKLAMTVASGRVANCLYLVLSSGLDSNIGLTLACELVNNPHMQALIDKCHENIRHGESFDKALLLSGIFSQMYASWIAIGSRTGEMESIVSQREINTDTASYLTALRAALRQSPDVILLGEMRDYETINTAVTAAETGHMIFSSLHTIGAANTIDRIIDAFPATQQHQISVQLASVLQAVVCQKLLPSVNGEMIPAFEIMVLTPAIRNLIREGKVHQINGIIYTSAAENMIAMDSSILQLYKDGRIDKHTAISEAVNPEIMSKHLNLL